MKYSDCNLFFLIDVDIDVDGGGEIDGTRPFEHRLSAHTLSDSVSELTETDRTNSGSEINFLDSLFLSSSVSLIA